MGRLGIATELLDKVVKEAKVYGCGTIYITASSFWESRQIGIYRRNHLDGIRSISCSRSA